MRRFLSTFALLVLSSTAAGADTPAEPTLYDLVINGESFTVEANRSMKLVSKKQPGVTYEIALRVAQVQRLVLNNLRVDYDREYEVSDDKGKGARTATLKHELGFTVVLSDVGGELKELARGQVLDTLQKSMEKSFRADKAEEIKIAPRHARKFQHAEGEGVTIQYHDAEGRAQSCLVYALTGKGFTAGAIVQFADADHEDVLPLVKKILDSVQSKASP
jgi:hypothetical protein